MDRWMGYCLDLLSQLIIQDGALDRGLERGSLVVSRGLVESN